MPTPPCLRLTLASAITPALESESRHRFIAQASRALSAARAAAIAAANPAGPAPAGRP